MAREAGARRSNKAPINCCKPNRSLQCASRELLLPSPGTLASIYAANTASISALRVCRIRQKGQVKEPDSTVLVPRAARQAPANQLIAAPSMADASRPSAGHRLPMAAWRHRLLAACCCWGVICPVVHTECGSARGLELASKLRVQARLEHIASSHPNATLLSIDPPLVHINGFLSAAAAQRIVRLTDSSLEYSETQAGISRSVTSSEKTAEQMMRNSKTAWCSPRVWPEQFLRATQHQHQQLTGCAYDAHVTDAAARVADLIDHPRETFEDLQVLRYRAGEHYHAHHDYLPGATQTSIPALGSGGGENPRVMTMFFYLNDMPEDAGGETEFPDAVPLPSTGAAASLPANVQWVDGRLRVRPRLGSALLWSNVMDTDTLCAHPHAKHAALDVSKTAARNVMKRVSNVVPATKSSPSVAPTTTAVVDRSIG